MELAQLAKIIYSIYFPFSSIGILLRHGGGAISIDKVRLNAACINQAIFKQVLERDVYKNNMLLRNPQKHNHENKILAAIPHPSQEQRVTMETEKFCAGGG